MELTAEHIGIALIAVAVLAAIAGAFTLAPQGWRTVAINATIAGIAVLAEVAGWLVGFDWRQVLPPEWAPWAVLSVNVLNIALRAVTTAPMGEKRG